MTMPIYRRTLSVASMSWKRKVPCVVSTVTSMLSMCRERTMRIESDGKIPSRR